MGRHGKRRRLGWVIPALAAALAAGIGVSAAYATGSPRSHPSPLPVFTTEPAFPSPQRSSQPSPAPSAVISYRIVSGDTLTSIARVHCGPPADWLSLQKANHIGNPNAISIGEVIKIAC